MYKIDETRKIISAEDSCFDYMGRIDFSDKKAPMLIWPGSRVDVKFTGTYCGVLIRDIPFQEFTHFAVLVDGVMQKFFLKHTGETELYIAGENLEQGEHILTVLKTEAAHNYFCFMGVVIDENEKALPLNHKYDMNIEVYGDSVSAGEVTEALYYEGQADPPNHMNKLDNSWFAYPQILGRMLNARVHDIAQGGIALFDKTGYFCAHNITGMESCYDKLAYSPDYEKSEWDFSRYTPNLVIIAIGQNDNYPDPECIHRADYRRRWKDKYIEILRDLMGKYPNAEFILTLTLIRHDPEWDKALDEITAEVNSSRVTHFVFRRNGLATAGHPRASEQAEMAAELRDYILKTKEG